MGNFWQRRGRLLLSTAFAVALLLLLQSTRDFALHQRSRMRYHESQTHAALQALTTRRAATEALQQRQEKYDQQEEPQHLLTQAQSLATTTTKLTPSPSSRVAAGSHQSSHRHSNLHEQQKQQEEQQALSCNTVEHVEYDGAVVKDGSSSKRKHNGNWQPNAAACCQSCQELRGCNVWVFCG